MRLKLLFIFVFFSGNSTADIHGPFEQQGHPDRGELHARLAVHRVGEYGWAGARVERRLGLQSMRVERGPSGSRAVRPVQPQVHDARLRVHEYGLLAALGRGELRGRRREWKSGGGFVLFMVIRE